MVKTVAQTQETSVGATRTGMVDFTNDLGNTEKLTGTPLVVEITTADLTLANKTVNTTVQRIRGRRVGVGKAVLFTVSGMQAGITYRIRVTATTDATPAQVIPIDLLLKTVS